MNYRRLGRTGLEVSEIGFGAEWMPGDDQEKVSRLVDFAAEQAVIQLADDFPTGHIAGVTWQQAIRWFRDIDADHLIGTGDFLLGILRLHGSTARKQRNYGKRRRNRLEQTGSDAAIRVL